MNLHLSMVLILAALCVGSFVGFIAATLLKATHKNEREEMGLMTETDYRQRLGGNYPKIELIEPEDLVERNNLEHEEE